MSQHLSLEEIELLSRYKLRGKRLPAALSHIESCAECREKVKSPSKAEIAERLSSDRNEDQSIKSNAKSK